MSPNSLSTQVIHAIDQKVSEIPKNPEIPKMLQSPTNDHLLRLSMLLLRKFLKFPKFKKLPYHHYLNRFINNLSENVTKLPKIPKHLKMPICSGHMLTDKYLLEFSKCKKFQNISCDICTWNR